MSVDNEVIVFEVWGNINKMKNFIEYIRLLNYSGIESFPNNTPYSIVIDTEQKIFTERFLAKLPVSLNVEKDAEEIDRLITGPNKNLTEARDKFFKAIEDIEVNEPKEVSQITQDKHGDIYLTWTKSDTGDIVFKNNTTLGQTPLTPNECHKIKNAPEKDLSKEWNELHNISLGVKHNQGKLPIDTVLTKQFPNAVEGYKESTNKLNYELDWDFLQNLAERMASNKGKYKPYNWKKPIQVESLKQSLFRHIIEVMKGSYKDDGRDYGHLEAIALNAMFIFFQINRKE